VISPFAFSHAGPITFTGSNALIKNAFVFVLSVLPTNYVVSASSISKVSFQYGTDLCGPNVPGHLQLIPEPGTIALAAVGLLFAAMLSRSRKQR
jgi:hypothetical protein